MADKWICECGEENTGRFCTLCSRMRKTNYKTLKVSDKEAVIDRTDITSSSFQKNNIVNKKKIAADVNDSDSSEILNTEMKDFIGKDSIQLNTEEMAILESYSNSYSADIEDADNDALVMNNINTIENSTSISKKNEYEYAATNSGNKYKIGFICALLVAVFGVLYITSSDDSSSNINSSSSSYSSKESKKDKSKHVDSMVSLGGINMFDSWSKIEKSMGKPIKKSNSDGGMRYYYKDLQVVVNNNVVVALVSETGNVSTGDGFHQGSDFSEIYAKYGEEYSLFEFEGLVMHEYKYTASNGEICLIRFSVNKNNKVDYISIRQL